MSKTHFPGFWGFPVKQIRPACGARPQGKADVYSRHNPTCKHCLSATADSIVAIRRARFFAVDPYDKALRRRVDVALPQQEASR